MRIGDHMKSFWKIFTALILVLVCLAVYSCNQVSREIKYTELGIPTSASYKKPIVARCAWDLKYFDGKLFVGAGDYDANSGPVDIWYYDFDKGNWEFSGSVYDEEVSRFTVINGKLIAPGIDPKDGWELGNYYEYNGSKWIKRRKIPGSIHNFDMIEYDSMIFAGLGVAEGQHPIACSVDGGETFKQLKLIKDGKALYPVGTHIRVYDFYTLNGELYAIFRRYGENMPSLHEVYKYKDGEFVYHDTMDGKLNYSSYKYNYVGDKEEFCGNVFMTTGYLYMTDDMSEFVKIDLTGAEKVHGLTVYNNKLYALGCEQSPDGTYRVSVWENKDGSSDGFKELCYFNYNAPPISIEYAKGQFFIGIGDRYGKNEYNGMVLSVDYNL